MQTNFVQTHQSSETNAVAKYGGYDYNSHILINIHRLHAWGYKINTKRSVPLLGPLCALRHSVHLSKRAPSMWTPYLLTFYPLNKTDGPRKEFHPRLQGCLRYHLSVNNSQSTEGSLMAWAAKTNEKEQITFNVPWHVPASNCPITSFSLFIARGLHERGQVSTGFCTTLAISLLLPPRAALHAREKRVSLDKGERVALF